MKHISILSLALLLACPRLAWATNGDDVGLIVEAAAEKKISKQASVELSAEFRSRNSFRTADRFSVGVGGEYKPIKWLKLDAGYQLLIENSPEKITYNAPNPTVDEQGNPVPNYNNWRPSYWGPRHRIYASVTVSYKLGRIGLSLRERWRYTYRPEKTVTRYDFDNRWWEDERVLSKGAHMLRSRLKLVWDIPKSKFEPWASVELFNNLRLEKVRYSAGVDYTLQKKHVFGLYYRYQHIHDPEETEPNIHSTGMSYKFKF